MEKEVGRAANLGCTLSCSHDEMTLFVGTPGLSLDIGAGRSYVDNLNNARTNDLKEESGFTSTWISVGLSERALKEARLYLKGSYEGAYYDYFSYLSVNGLIAEAGLFSPVTHSEVYHISDNTQSHNKPGTKSMITSGN